MSTHIFFDDEGMPTGRASGNKKKKSKKSKRKRCESAPEETSVQNSASKMSEMSEKSKKSKRKRCESAPEETSVQSSASKMSEKPHNSEKVKMAHDGNVPEKAAGTPIPKRKRKRPSKSVRAQRAKAKAKQNMTEEPSASEVGPRRTVKPIDTTKLHLDVIPGADAWDDLPPGLGGGYINLLVAYN
jgi:hypothetical protein